jgi:hypothetical protein
MSCPYSRTAILSLVVASAVPVAHAMRIANEQGAHPLLLAEGDDFACAFVAETHGFVAVCAY